MNDPIIDLDRDRILKSKKTNATFQISEESIQKIKYWSKKLNMSQSKFIDFIIERIDKSLKK